MSRCTSEGYAAMKARDVMTTNVVSVAPEMPTREIAKLFLEKAISAVPVVDRGNAPVGMVSEGDLIGRSELEREARWDWWLALLAEGGAFDAELLAGLRSPERTARDIMSGPVVTVTEDSDVGEIARLLTSYRIKRVPVLREGRIVGIVSRADLLRALAVEEPPRPSAGGLFGSVIAGLDERFRHNKRPEPGPTVLRVGQQARASLTVADFQRLVTDFKHKEVEDWQETRRAAAERQRHLVTELIDQHVSDEGWRGLLHKAREAAEHGQKEFMLLQFPSQLCSDGGRAINAMEPDWPATLRGEAAEIYLRWELELKPHGFHLGAQVVDFPDGIPGDIGLFLVWGQ
jgi:CBS domain-containing protein